MTVGGAAVSDGWLRSGRTYQKTVIYRPIVVRHSVGQSHGGSTDRVMHRVELVLRHQYRLRKAVITLNETMLGDSASYWLHLDDIPINYVGLRCDLHVLQRRRTNLSLPRLAVDINHTLTR